MLIDVIMDFEIADKLGVFISDNPDTNGNAIKHTLEIIDPVEKDHLSRWSRCIGHILNLAARNFIFGDDVEAFEYDMISQRRVQRRCSTGSRRERPSMPGNRREQLVSFIILSSSSGRVRRGEKHSKG